MKEGIIKNMRKKYEQSYVEDYFKKEGYTIAEEFIYENCKAQIKTICPKGHDYETSFSNFKTGKRCPRCLGLKITYDEIKSYVESKGYKLKSNTYINAHIKMDLICPNNHDYLVDMNSFKDGARCPICQNRKVWKKEEVINIIEKEGYELLTKKYMNATQKLKLLCPNNHNIKISFSDFNTNGIRCVICSGFHKLEYSEVKNRIEKCEGFILLSKRYKSKTTRMNIQCPLGHKFKESLASFERDKYKCPICANEHAKGENHYNWQGGISSERDMIKRLPQYQNWRKRVLNRDNNICQCCGETDNLHVHHIRNFEERKDLRFITSNGITLCERCHSPIFRGSFHYIYNTKKNNKKQLDKYIGLYGKILHIGNKVELHKDITETNLIKTNT